MNRREFFQRTLGVVAVTAVAPLLPEPKIPLWVYGRMQDAVLVGVRGTFTMADIDDVLRAIYLPAVKAQLNAPTLFALERK